MTENNANTNKPEKKKGRPFGTGTGNTKMLRTLITPRHEKLLAKLRESTNTPESEHVRRAIEMYLKKLIKAGQLQDLGQDEKE